MNISVFQVKTYLTYYTVLNTISGIDGGKYFNLDNNYYQNNYQGSKVIGNAAFIDFLMDYNQTLTDEGLRNAFNLLNVDSNEEFDIKNAKGKYFDFIIIHLRFLQPHIDIISPKYTVSDLIANFGGQFGLFEQVSGASFLGILNLIIIMFKLCLSKSHGQ